MRRLGSVQQKIQCVFVTEVKEETSRKRDGQDALTSGLGSTGNPTNRRRKGSESISILTEVAKVPRDQPQKMAEIWLRFYRALLWSSGFTWNVEEDFKAVPDTWIPAHRVKHANGHPLPDEHGHIPGWVPVQKNNKQYCWHSSVVDHKSGTALVLRPSTDDGDSLEIAAVPLEDLMEQTLELIGTNVNGNPYEVGSRKHPVHCLVSHGSLEVRNAPPVDFQQLRSWFQECPEGRVEGIVWHCNDGTLIKVHRHHLGLRWPDGDTRLASRPLVVHVDTPLDEHGGSEDLFACFSRLNGHIFGRMRDVEFDP
ncbi:hypothetical protein fugu_011400 [Takifugu bimaculatus]|uniref:RNA ligase 1 n=1 Tax=Takifugu bimaculatus TaxID=433685 RepID=A0A4Z2C7L8_9TELE|nr:hypothetical protein fugu_011400 [Takifugu bimaculatus]